MNMDLDLKHLKCGTCFLLSDFEGQPARKEAPAQEVTVVCACRAGFVCVCVFDPHFDPHFKHPDSSVGLLSAPHATPHHLSSSLCLSLALSLLRAQRRTNDSWVQILDGPHRS